MKYSLNNSIYITWQAEIFLNRDIVKKTKKKILSLLPDKHISKNKEYNFKNMTRCRRPGSFRYLLAGLGITSICKSLANNITQA